ncbi:DUF169 domain-containing protein [Halodesulfovibrio marinisediminis]|uniref:Uncharacterized ArCR, COG2043 n=1 Tax=Halodesulfovibrio marinisediminis DSM 17456 TaxID=1121457 RepID=A0A1N6I346_9BACT|nr:DUF169 domain-containing protein [Halodesulfovibrio marinisediminis]SIO26345.1 Uncharacterised ArCR, COG2043 [Halodesulfovibrio marinisediminis DSM 17456]
MEMTILELCKVVGIETRPVGVYDAPDAEQFAPLVDPKRCIFAAYEAWQAGQTLSVTSTKYGCPGCGYWMTGIETFPSREVFVNFLYNKEGMRESAGLMNAWLDATPPYHPQHGNILIGPVHEEMEEYLKTVTFFVTPDQLSTLMLGAVYHSHPDDVEPVIAPFGSGCGQMLSLFRDLNKPQAIIGATDIAMRSYIPADHLAFTVTIPMLKRFLSLDKERCFLGKHFLKKLKQSRVETKERRHPC